MNFPVNGWVKMSEEKWMQIEVFPDLSFHLYLDGKDFHGLSNFGKIKEILLKRKDAIDQSL